MTRKVLHLTCATFALVGATQLSHASSTRYFYDELNRLARVERADGIVVTYTYDALGNRISKSVIHDMDFDGTADAQDCAPSDATAFAIPAEVTNQVLGSNKVTLTWTSAAPSSGSGTVHDVSRGRIRQLPVGSGAAETCIGLGIAATSISDATVPAAGVGFWYLVRGHNVCGAGTYGFRSNGAERITTVCP